MDTTRTKSAYAEGPRSSDPQEVYFDPNPSNFPDIDDKFSSQGTWSGAEYSRFMHTEVELSQMDSDLRLKACRYLVSVVISSGLLLFLLHTHQN